MQAENPQEVLVPGDTPAFPDDIDTHPFGLAGVADNADAGELEPLSIDAHERGGALPVAGAGPALAEGTAGVELAGKAEGAIAAKLEALVPWAQGVADRKVERLPREGNLGKRVHQPRPEALPQKGERKPQVLPPKGGCKPEALPRKGGRNHDVKPHGSPANEGKREGERSDAIPSPGGLPPGSQIARAPTFGSFRASSEVAQKNTRDSLAAAVRTGEYVLRAQRAGPPNVQVRPSRIFSFVGSSLGMGELMEAQKLGSPTCHSLPSDQSKRGRGHGRPHQQTRCGASVVAGTKATNNRCPWFPGRPP